MATKQLSTSIQTELHWNENIKSCKRLKKEIKQKRAIAEHNNLNIRYVIRNNKIVEGKISLFVSIHMISGIYVNYKSNFLDTSKFLFKNSDLRHKTSSEIFNPSFNFNNDSSKFANNNYNNSNNSC